MKGVSTVEDTLRKVVSKGYYTKRTRDISDSLENVLRDEVITRVEFEEASEAIEEYIFTLSGQHWGWTLEYSLRHNGLRSDYKYILALLRDWGERPHYRTEEEVQQLWNVILATTVYQPFHGISMASNLNSAYFKDVITKEEYNYLVSILENYVGNYDRLETALRHNKLPVDGYYSREIFLNWKNRPELK